MGVRIPVELKHDDRIVTSASLVNSGYEADEPEIHIPMALARLLGFKLEELKGERYKVVGAEVATYILGRLFVRVKIDVRDIVWVEARAVMVPGEYEVILSDALIEKLGVEIVKPKTGLWRFSGESKIRESVEAEFWIE